MILVKELRYYMLIKSYTFRDQPKWLDFVL